MVSDIGQKCFRKIEEIAASHTQGVRRKKNGLRENPAGRH